VPTEVNNALHSPWNALAQTVLVENVRTLEGLVREMLRPMLRSWLDDNLPSLVERLVHVEIERIAGSKHERRDSDIIFG
jgi:cell pole-organizing protein PopZ